MLVSFTVPIDTNSGREVLFLAHSFTDFSMSLAGSIVLNLCRENITVVEHIIKEADHLKHNKRKLKGLGQSLFFRNTS